VSVRLAEDLIPEAVAHVQAAEDLGPRLADFFEALLDKADTVL
jgi:hypothetical protein